MPSFYLEVEGKLKVCFVKEPYSSELYRINEEIRKLRMSDQELNPLSDLLESFRQQLHAVSANAVKNGAYHEI